ncbi:Zinc-transporting ATPase [Pirellula sp. SH-Sr6A]|uniref:heavy metal translocating P-type ATPase n=1 Tax=Pirellula sp. SH-Sr6A TaxID=1632865 RepID=UPI00078CAB70|nr:heavy metal translocating P-type ATPase [Pirellula sp. SH-Sr6A]AMV33836.1 Zinc-transporting ATPase [Pirellula sp. SH-Sr6A]
MEKNIPAIPSKSLKREHSEPPKWEAIQTFVCFALGLTGFLLQRFLSPEYQYGALIPLVGAYLAGGNKTATEAAISLWHRKLNIDLLMILAALGAAILGDWVEGVILLFLFSLSGTLEAFASYRTNRSIEALIRLRPSTANRLVVNSSQSTAPQEESVPIESLAVGDCVRVRPGERYPVDGKIVDGETWVDESTLTGESRPIAKQKGADVYSGTMNGAGTVVVEMRKEIGDTTLERIVAMVHEAQTKKTATERFVDTWQQPYVIAVIVGALVTFFATLFWNRSDANDAFYHAMVLLVAASPCAVVLSSPSVMLSAIALAGRHGVLVKGGTHIEHLGTIDVLAMDKTGTITMGKPTVQEIWTPPGCSPNKLLAYAALVETQSEHPLAQPILDELAKRGEPIPNVVLQEFHSHTGLGVHASIDGVWVGIGKESLFESHDHPFPASIQEQVSKMRERGETALPVVTSDPGMFGIISVTDPLRSDTDSTLKTLKGLAIPKIVLLTGDHPRVAQAIAGKLPFDEIVAGLMPDEKVKHLVRLGEGQKCIAMVGDGVNDAPALATADVGIAMGGVGSDVALEVADVVLMRDNLSALPIAIWIGRVANRRVRQNLFFSFSMIGLLVASSFFNLPMWMGVLGHEGSTLLVVFNGIRLLWTRIPDSLRGVGREGTTGHLDG